MTIYNRDEGVDDSASKASSADEVYNEFDDMNTEAATGVFHTNLDSRSDLRDDTDANMEANLDVLAGLNINEEVQPKQESTPVDLFGAGSGTYSDSVLKTPRVVKNENTAISGENKVRFDVETKGPKYKLFSIPIEGPHPLLCMTLKSGGATICLNRDCSIKHKGLLSRGELKPNHAYVSRVDAKGNVTGYTQPVMNLNLMEDDYSEELLQSTKTLDEWNFLSGLMASQVMNLAGRKFKSEDMETGLGDAVKVKLYQSPAMNKAKQTLTDGDVKSTEAPTFSFTYQKDNINDYSEEELKGSLKTLDNNLVRLKAFCKQFYRLFKHDHIELAELSNASTSQIQDLQRLVGTRPTDLNPDLQAPSLWASYAILAHKIESWMDKIDNSAAPLSMSEHQKKSLVIIEEQVRKLISQVNTIDSNMQSLPVMEKKVNSAIFQASTAHTQSTNLLPLKSDVKKHGSRLKRMESFASQATQHIKRQESLLQDIKNGWTGGFGTVNQKSVGNNFNFSSGSEQGDWNGKISILEAKVKDLQLNNDSEVVKFGKLNIRTVKDSYAWLEANHPEDDFGDVVDFHCAMEHVNCQITGEDILVQLHKSYRIDIQDLNQAYLMKSFERQIPRYLDSSSKHYSVDLDQSHFPEIKSYADWDKQDDGSKARLESELAYFVGSHHLMLADRLQHEYPAMYTIASLALAETENFVIAWINFIEKTYRLYVRHRYNAKKAWYITSMLAKKVIIKISEPRNNIQKSFRRGDMKQIKASTFLAMLQSLDIMNVMRSGGLENDPDVAAELVRFVSLQSDANAIEDLKTW